MILTQCFPPDLGGIEVLMGGLARELAATGVPVLVLADRVRGGGGEVALPGVTLRRFGGLKPIRRWRKGLALRRALAAGAAGVFCDSWKSAALLPADGPPAVALAHGTELPAPTNTARVARVRSALARVGVVVANSAFTAALAGPVRGAGQSLMVLHPPIDPPAGNAAVGALAPGAVWRGGSGPMLLTVARLEPRKGIDMVIRALPTLAAQHAGLRYVVAGAGGDFGRLRALAAACGVADRVTFVGAVGVTEKARLFPEADVFAMPARREGASIEGFGIVYREAAWWGVPSVAGRDGGAAEAVRDGETGLVCDGRDADAVAAALGRLLDDTALRTRLGAAAAAVVRAEGLWAHALPRFLAALAAARGAPAAL